LTQHQEAPLPVWTNNNVTATGYYHSLPLVA